MVMNVDGRPAEDSKLLALELDNSGILIEAAFWIYEEENQRWRFYLATDDVARDGPLAVYTAAHAAIDRLAQAHPGFTIESDDLRAIEPADPLVWLVREATFSLMPSPPNMHQLPGYRACILWSYRTPPMPVAAIRIRDANGSVTMDDLLIVPIIAHMGFAGVSELGALVAGAQFISTSETAMPLLIGFHPQEEFGMVRVDDDSVRIHWLEKTGPQVGFIPWSELQEALVRLHSKRRRTRG